MQFGAVQGRGEPIFHLKFSQPSLNILSTLSQHSLNPLSTFSRPSLNRRTSKCPLTCFQHSLVNPVNMPQQSQHFLNFPHSINMYSPEKELASESHVKQSQTTWHHHLKKYVCFRHKTTVKQLPSSFLPCWFPQQLWKMQVLQYGTGTPPCLWRAPESCLWWLKNIASSLLTKILRNGCFWTSSSSSCSSCSSCCAFHGGEMMMSCEKKSLCCSCGSSS